MKSRQWIALLTLVVAFSGFSPASLSAQTQVALIDMGQVFESHPGFKAELNRLKQEADGLQSSVLQQQQALAREQEDLRTLFTPGSREFREKEKEIALKGTQAELDATDRMRQLMQAEAQLHYEIYRQVNQLIDQYCEQYGIRLVLRLSGTTVQPDQPESIMQKINSPIVYYQPNRDITAAISQRLQQVRGAANQPATPLK